MMGAEAGSSVLLKEGGNSSALELATTASPFLYPWSELKGADEGRTWELDHPGFRVKAPVSC